MATSARLSPSSSSSLLCQEDEEGRAGTYCIYKASIGAQGFRNRGDMEGQM